MNKIFRKGCQMGCFSIILLGIFIGAAISLQSYVEISNEYKYAYSTVKSSEISIITSCKYHREWFKHYVGSPYTFEITIIPFQESDRIHGLRYVKLINRTHSGMTIEINSEFMKVFKDENQMIFFLEGMEIPYDDYDVMIGFTYEENGATKNGEINLELKREPSISRGNYFIDLFKL